MVMTINNPDTGAEATKPAMYIEANVHGNEIQGAEVCLYTIWYLMEHYDRLPRIKQAGRRARLLHRADGEPRRPRALPEGARRGGRSGHEPVDNDNDGVADEDDVDDLNGNGVIEQMRQATCRARARTASARLDPRLLEPAPPGTKGDYVILGIEGLDNDGDGHVNEDRSAATTQPQLASQTGSRTTSRTARWTIRSSCPKRARCNDFLLSQPEHRRRAVVPQPRRHDPARPRRRGAGRVSGADVRVYDELGRQASGCCRTTATW